MNIIIGFLPIIIILILIGIVFKSYPEIIKEKHISKKQKQRINIRGIGKKRNSALSGSRKQCRVR